MRVLHYITGISPNIGGIESFILNAFQHKEEDLKVEILTRYVDRDTEMYRMFAQQHIIIHDLNVHHLNIKTYAVFLGRLKGFLKENAGRYDVLHCHCLTDPFVCRLARKAGVHNILLHVHSYLFGEKSLGDRIKRFFCADNCRWANQYLACSADVGKAVYPERYRDQLTVVNNGIDFEKYRYDAKIRNTIRRQYKLEDQFVVAHVGRICRDKNHEFLIRIFKSVLNKRPDSKLLLIGDGPLRPQMEELCRTLAIEDKVMFFGNRSDANILIQSADVFVFPSVAEGFGMVALEAQASGLPTFVSDNLPKTIQVSDLVKFISLRENAETWADSVLLAESTHPREEYFRILQKTEYDAGKTYMTLKKLYSKTTM